MQFKKLYIDADKFIYAASSVVQKNGCKATFNKNPSKTKIFENKTEFNKWADENKKFSREDFTTESVVVELEPIENAYFALKAMLKQFDVDWADEVVYVIHGEGNFREEHATLAQYKGNRPPKPVLYQKVKDYFISSFSPTVVYGEETDDYVARKMYQGYLEAKKAKSQSKASVCIASEDKDLTTVPGWLWLFTKEDSPQFITAKEANKNFCVQLLQGDSSDNIKGLWGVTDSIIEKYGLRKGLKGMGAKSAEKVMERGSIKDVVWCYKEVWGDKWKDVIRENALLLRMRREEGEIFDIVKSLEDKGVV